MGRHALLVATGLYEDPQLSQLRAPAQDVSRLAAVLEDPAVGGFDEVRVPSDSTDYEIRVALTDLLADRDRDDLVLAYFSCHGISTLSNRLFFAATNTVHKRPAGTAVARSFVNEQMEDCHAASRILLLDCCFSGAYSDGMKPAPATVMGKAGEGYVVLTASDALEYSWEADTLSLEAPRSSVFTDVLITALTDPATDTNGDGWLTLDEVFRQVQEGVVARRPDQNPKMFAHAAEPNQIRLARAILVDSLSEPALHIVRNAGFDEDEIPAEKLTAIPWGQVFDANQGQLVDAFSAQLVDSAAVVKAAVVRAVALVQRFLLIG